MSILAVIPLLGAFLLAFFSPKRGVLCAAAVSAFWFEWDIGIRLAIFEMLFLGGLLGLVAWTGLRVPDVRCRNLVLLFVALTWTSWLYVHTDIFKGVWSAFKSSLYPASFFLFYAAFANWGTAEKAIRLFLYSASASAVIGLLQVATHRPLAIFFTGTYKDALDLAWETSQYEGGVRIISSLAHPVMFGTFMVMPIAILASKLVGVPDSRRSLTNWGMLAALVLGLTASLTRAAWAGMVLSAVVIVLFYRVYRHRLFFPALLCACVFAVAAVGLKLVPARFVNRFVTLGHASKDRAMIPRYERWSYFLNRSFEKPWLGWGVVADEETIEHFEHQAVSPHNTFIFTAVQRGWPATGVMMLILASVVKSGWLAARRAAPGASKALAVGLFSGLLGTYAVASMFTPIWEDEQGTVVFWLVAALTLRMHRNLVAAGLAAEAEGPVAANEVIGPEEAQAPEAAPTW